MLTTGYAHGTRAGAGAQWIISEVSRRTEEILRLPMKKRYVPPSDQALLCDALATATNGGTPAYGLACEHRVLKANSSYCSPNRTMLPRRMMRPQLRNRSSPLVSPFARGPLAAARAPEASHRRSGVRTRILRSRRRRRGRKSGGEKMGEAIAFGELHVAGNPRVETAARAPEWLFPRGWDAQLQGA